MRPNKTFILYINEIVVNRLKCEQYKVLNFGEKYYDIKVLLFITFYTSHGK